jgi:hypothetical protein
MSNLHERRSRTIPQNWKAHEVQAALEFNLTEWQRFLYHTGKEGNRLKLESEVSQWRDVRAKPKLTLIDNVKTRLKEEGISTKDQLEQAINWRMRQFFKAKKPKPGSPRKPFGSKPPRSERSRKGFQSPSLLENEASETEAASDEEEIKPEDKQEEDGDGLVPKGMGKEAVSKE